MLLKYDYDADDDDDDDEDYDDYYADDDNNDDDDDDDDDDKYDDEDDNLQQSHDDSAYDDVDVECNDEKLLQVVVDDAPHSCGDDSPQSELLLLGHFFASACCRSKGSKDL